MEEEEKEEEKNLVLPPAKPHIVSEMEGYEQEEPSLQTEEQRSPGEEFSSSLRIPDQASLPLTGELRSGIQLCSVKLCNCVALIIIMQWCHGKQDWEELPTFKLLPLRPFSYCKLIS